MTVLDFILGFSDEEMDPENFETTFRNHIFFHELGHLLAFQFLEDKSLKTKEPKSVKMENLLLTTNQGVVYSDYLDELEFPPFAVVLMAGVIFEVLFCKEELRLSKEFEILFGMHYHSFKGKPLGDQIRFRAGLRSLFGKRTDEVYDEIISETENILTKHKDSEIIKTFHDSFKTRIMKYSKENEFYIIDEDQLILDAEMKEFTHGVFEELLQIIHVKLSEGQESPVKPIGNPKTT